MNALRIRRRQRFTRLMKKQTEAEYQNGRINRQKYNEVMAKLDDSRVMDKAIAQLEADPTAWGDFDWAKLWQWIKDNWMEIAKLILSLVVMFLDDEEETA